MQAFADLIISFIELIEAEGRTFREKAVLVMEGFLIMFFGVSLIIYGIFALGAAIYISLCDHIGKPASALLVAALFTGVGVWLLSKGRRITYGKGGPDVGPNEEKTES